MAQSKTIEITEYEASFLMSKIKTYRVMLETLKAPGAEMLKDVEQAAERILVKPEMKIEEAA